jgi:hypothetical protein
MRRSGRKALWVWTPLFLTSLLLSGFADAKRGVPPARRPGIRQALVTAGSSLGFDGCLALGSLLTTVGGLVCLAKRRDED